MASKLPSFIRLPGYNQFDYKPRHYDQDKERRDKARKRINFRSGAFLSYSPLSDQLKRQKIYSRKKVALITLLIRVIIVILLVAIIYLVFQGVVLMKQSS